MLFITLMTKMSVTAFEDSRVEMGRNHYGLQCWIASYSERVQLHMGSSGSSDEGCSASESFIVFVLRFRCIRHLCH